MLLLTADGSQFQPLSSKHGADTLDAESGLPVTVYYTKVGDSMYRVAIKLPFVPTLRPIIESSA